MNVDLMDFWAGFLAAPIFFLALFGVLFWVFELRGLRSKRPK